MMANIMNLIGDLFAQDYEHIERPGSHEEKRFSSAQPVDEREYDSVLARFREGGADG